MRAFLSAAILAASTAILGASTAVVAAQDFENAIELEGDWYESFSEAWNARVFIDSDFVCSDRDLENTFFVVYGDPEFNENVDLASSAVWKSLLAFSFERGRARCVYREGAYRFRAIGIYDDEVILDMPFEVAEEPGASIGAMFPSEAAMIAFRDLGRRSFTPVED